MKENHWEEFLDRTLKFAIGFGALNDGDIFSPLSRIGKMEQFRSIFAVWVQILPPYTLCK